MNDTNHIVRLLLAAVAVACGFVIVIAAGFYLRGQTPPPPLGQLFVPACAILATIVAWAIILVLRDPPIMPWTGRRRQRESIRAWEAELAARIAVLTADAVGRQYVDRVQRGEAWSDDQIAYDQDRSRTVTCPHLQPIEADMRSRGLYLKLLTSDLVDAQCRIEPLAFAETWPDPVRYGERYESDRGGARDFLFAEVSCKACPSLIRCIPSELARDETPGFPAPPKA